jgi:hypothetical protein
MNRALRAIGLALVVSAALAAVATSTASAEEFIFTSEVESPTLKGEQSGSSTMKFEAGTVSCSGATFEGAMTGKSAVEENLAAAFSGCTYMGGSGSVIEMHSCKLVLASGNIEGSQDIVEAGIACEKTEDVIKVVLKVFGVTTCTIEIGAQRWLTSATVANTGSPTALLAHLTLAGIHYNQKAGSGGFPCKAGENKENGTYESEIVIKGTQGGVQKKLNAEPIPQKVDVNPGTVKLKGAKTSETFVVENLVNEAIMVTGFISGQNLSYKKNCANLAKKGDPGDTCKEEVTCGFETKAEAKVAVLTFPFGGAIFKVDGC